MNSSLQNLLRAHYRDLKGYVSAGMEMTKSAEKLFLNANENPYELPGLDGFNRYPEPQSSALAAAYAKTYGVNPDQIMMTRGADEAIVILTKLFCEPHKDAVLICPPTFGMYGVNANAMPAKLVEVPLIKTETTFKLDVDTIIKTATSPSPFTGEGQGEGGQIKLVYLCSPNNPTATSFAPSDMEAIISALDGHAVVILDETYAEFASQPSFTNKLAAHPNLIILRTLSKSYALAGMRMGCFISGDADFITLAKTKAMDAYPLPHASINAALHVLSDEIRPIAMKNIAKLIAERKRVKAELEKSDKITRVFESDANFLLIEMPRAPEFVKFCAENNVIIRDFSSKPQTENCIRLSIGLPQDNDLVLELLKKFDTK